MGLGWIRAWLVNRITIFVIAAVFVPFSTFADSNSDSEFFEKRIRPLLLERCEICHSAATGKTSGGLALDTRDAWSKGGDSGPAIVPGNPDESLLMRAVSYIADGPQMPPKEKGGKLPDGDIAALREWIVRGAHDPRTKPGRTVAMTPEEVRTWWSFQKIGIVNLPSVKNSDWCSNEVDRFVLAELEKHDMSPASSADRRTLLRRATYDLTGLPPTPAEIDAFLTDKSPNPFGRVVDRLLDSPAYGQRWARHWLDVARYADFYDANPKTRTASCELTEAWRYRDWVVDSLNGDLPYDQFIQHQIAGDQLPSPTHDEIYPAGLIATTFLSNGVWDRGDADKEKIISDMADDNIDTIGKAFLGLTLGCARCHDHKFDPVSTEDYYALAGMFYSSHILKDLGAKGAEYDMNRVPLVPKAVLVEREKREEELKDVQTSLNSLDQEKRFKDFTAGSVPLVPTDFLSAPNSTGSISDAGVITVTGQTARDSYTIKATAPDNGEIRFVRLELLSDSNATSAGLFSNANQNFVINRFTLQFTPAQSSEPPTTVKWSSAKADAEKKGFAVAGAIDEKPGTGWSVDAGAAENHVAVFEVAPDFKIPARSALTIIIDQNQADNQPIGRFRISVSNSIAAPSPANEPTRAELNTKRDELQKLLSVPIPLAMAVQEGGMRGGLFPNIQDVPIHVRGSYTKLGDVVPRRMPRFLAGDQQPPIARGSGRRELANWVASKDNPLTARVIVNRIWQWHFGEGIVRTPSNFGKMGEPPTHPQLLDWLATKLIEDGWSIKALHRRIMLSATYQQASKVLQEAFQKDPENRWLGRFEPRRIEAESIRDAMLLVSGQLDSTPGGPADDDFTSHRRSLYVQTARWDRSNYAMLFDAANPDSSTEKRIVSTVAPQALLFLNHEFILNQAQRLATRLIADFPGDETARIQRAFELLFGRPAVDEELQIARRIVHSNQTDTQAQWTDLAHVLLCSSEFVYLD